MVNSVKPLKKSIKEKGISTKNGRPPLIIAQENPKRPDLVFVGRKKDIYKAPFAKFGEDPWAKDIHARSIVEKPLNNNEWLEEQKKYLEAEKKYIDVMQKKKDLKHQNDLNDSIISLAQQNRAINRQIFGLENELRFREDKYFRERMHELRKENDPNKGWASIAKKWGFHKDSVNEYGKKIPARVREYNYDRYIEHLKKGDRFGISDYANAIRKAEAIAKFNPNEDEMQEEASGFIFKPEYVGVDQFREENETMYTGENLKKFERHNASAMAELLNATYNERYKNLPTEAPKYSKFEDSVEMQRGKSVLKYRYYKDDEKEKDVKLKGYDESTFIDNSDNDYIKGDENISGFKRAAPIEIEENEPTIESNIREDLWDVKPAEGNIHTSDYDDYYEKMYKTVDLTAENETIDLTDD